MGTSATIDSVGTWSGTPTPSISHQWYRDGAAILGQTGITYVYQAGDAGKSIKVQEIATNAAGSASVFSNTIVVPAINAVLGANAGSYALTGNSAALLKTSTIDATAAGHYALTGSSALLKLLNVTDNFNRADGSLGSNWKNSSTLTGGAGIVINSNAAFNGTGNHRAAFWSDAVNTFANDQFAQVDGTGANGQGVVVRHDPSGASNFYMAFRFTNGTSLQIFRCDAGTFTGIGAATGPALTSGAKTLRLTITGSNLVATIDGVVQYTATDSTYTSGQPGIEVFGDSVDNFLAGPII